MLSARPRVNAAAGARARLRLGRCDLINSMPIGYAPVSTVEIAIDDPLVISRCLRQLSDA
jgi:hypothetical protein